MKHIIFLLSCILFTSCKSEPKQPKVDASYKAELEDYWKKKDEGRVSYLQLTGLFKLDSLANTFGKDSNNDHVLKIEAIPDTIGTIEVTKNGVLFSATEQVIVKTANDSVISSLPLELDEYGSSIKLYHEQINWQVITRSGQHYLRVWDTKNPAIDAFKGFKKFDPDPNYIFDVNFTYFENIKSQVVKAEVDGQRKVDFIGQITFTFNDDTYTLDVGGSGFTMVGDDTSGDTTYGGGRYIYIDLPEKNGSTILDLNKLYNPPCAYNEFTTCIYPPRQNYLPFKLEVGETTTFNK